MDLLQYIKSDRARQRKKRPYGRKVFHTVSHIIKRYALDENFLKLLDTTEDYVSQERMEVVRVKAKKALEFPPFSLASKEEYGLALTITGKVDNPYLQFAHSPEEIILSAPLYRANPLLTPADLLRYDFETLLLCQRAKEELADLEKRSGSAGDMFVQGKEMEESAGERSHLSSSQERTKQLQTFIAEVEHMESQPE